ncbi:hypothetical protein E2C01_079459 [Portunus trituberculatus]|uniref:Uncharacterized protein n=1 Tax=Portunus trituberculatus TaxID=210409 RepID=A0A5B7ILK6_PORTR|nr:hypothetical protein [Portunus trituberculatus]
MGRKNGKVNASSQEHIFCPMSQSVIGGTVVKKKLVIEPRKTDVLSRFKEESGNLWRKALVFKRSPDNSMAVNFCARRCIRYGSCGSISELRGRMNGVSASK